MLYVNKRLTGFVWYSPALDLRTSYSWKQYIRSLRRINPAGAGFVSFDPSRPANSLTTINPGDVLTLDALSIPAAGYFELDNGNPPVPRDAPDTMRFEFEPGPARTIDFTRQRLSKRAYPLFVQGIDVAKFSVNGGAYVDYFTASQQADALPDSDFSSQGPGMTLQVRLVLPALTDPLTIDYQIGT